jgi:hypothetical protein
MELGDGEAIDEVVNQRTPWSDLTDDPSPLAQSTAGGDRHEACRDITGVIHHSDSEYLWAGVLGFLTRIVMDAIGCRCRVAFGLPDPPSD